MSNYRRFYKPGGCYFFTVVTHDRRPLLCIPDNISLLRQSFAKVMAARPFRMDAMVVLPDHLHCIWTLPEDDGDFSTRWRLIKRHFSTFICSSVLENGEKKIWQRRFWEHCIRDDKDLHNHMNYIHYNPVKHGYARHPEDWEYSSYRRFAARGSDMDFRNPLIVDAISKMDFE